MSKETPCVMPIPNVAFCLEKLRQLIAVMPKTSRSLVKVEVLLARRKGAEEALAFLEYLLSPRAMDKPFQQCGEEARMPRIVPSKLRAAKGGPCKDESRMP